jgi:hypothetical protein
MNRNLWAFAMNLITMVILFGSTHKPALLQCWGLPKNYRWYFWTHFHLSPLISYELTPFSYKHNWMQNLLIFLFNLDNILRKQNTLCAICIFAPCTNCLKNTFYCSSWWTTSWYAVLTLTASILTSTENHICSFS